MTDDPNPDPADLPFEEVRANRAAWVAALRSPGYRQGQHLLRPTPDTYCCLGVAEDVRGVEWHRDADSGEFYLPDVLTPSSPSTNNGTHLSVAGTRWLGVVEANPCVLLYDPDPRVTDLVTLNDSGASFARIADVLADQPDDWDGSLEGCYADLARRRGDDAEVRTGDHDYDDDADEDVDPGTDDDVDDDEEDPT